jgi:hypothetical protein
MLKDYLNKINLVFISYNTIFIQIYLAFTSWSLLILFKDSMQQEVYTKFIYLFSYAHLISGVTSYIFIYSKIKNNNFSKNHIERINVMVLMTILLLLIFKDLLDVFFVIYSLLFLKRDAFFRSKIFNKESIKFSRLVVHFVGLIISYTIVLIYSISMNQGYIILGILNFIFSFSLITFKLDNFYFNKKLLKIDFESILMPITSQSRVIILSEFLYNSFSSVLYGEIYFYRNLLGPLGQIANLIILHIKRPKIKLNKISTIAILFLFFLSASSILLFILNRANASLAIGVLIALSEVIIATISFFLYINSKFKLIFRTFIYTHIISIIYFLIFHNPINTVFIVISTNLILFISFYFITIKTKKNKF